jgi:S-adenosylmethionine:tRNA ribosyltransferase-isomerase
VKSIDPELLVSDFDYHLPQELIAQEPLPDRTASRLLVVDRATNRITDDTLRHIDRWLRPGDLLVANNSRVLPARLQAKKVETGARVELLLLHPNQDNHWTALAKPAKKLSMGTRLVVPPRLEEVTEPALLEVVERGPEGEVTVRFLDDAIEHLEDYGAVPLPPYIHGRLDDPERYQTVYASSPGSAAAPTAGLHLTKEFIDQLKDEGIQWAEVTLHIGLDTFRPVTVERVEEHRIHTEWCSVRPEVAKLIQQTKQSGNRVVAVGTTAARTLETLGHAETDIDQRGFEGPTNIFITPGYTWKIVDALLTNFHLPRSTLLMMVSALAGQELIKKAYQFAIAEEYRFFSFGDAMLIV